MNNDKLLIFKYISFNKDQYWYWFIYGQREISHVSEPLLFQPINTLLDLCWLVSLKCTEIDGVDG